MKHAIDPVSTVKTYVVYEMLSQTQEKMLQKENITANTQGLRNQNEKFAHRDHHDMKRNLGT